MDEDTNTQTAEQPHFDADAEANAMFDRWNSTAVSEAEKPVEEKPAEQAEEKPAEQEEKVADKPVEKPAGEEIDIPGKGPKTEAAKQTWATMKRELKELQELRDQKLPATEKLANEREIALQEAQKRLAEFEGKDISQYEKKIAELESKFTEAEKFRAIHDVTNSESYKQEILLPADKIGKDVAILAKMYEVSTDALTNALQIQDPVEQRKAIKELTDGWDTLDVSDLMSAARQTRQLLEKSQAMLDNAEKTKGELRFIEEQESKRKAERDEAEFKAANEAIEKNMWEKAPRYKDRAEVREAVANAKVENTPTAKILGAKALAMIPHMWKDLDAKDARIKELEENLAKRVSAAPKVGAVTQTDKLKNSDGPTDFSPEAIMARWQTAQAS